MGELTDVVVRGHFDTPQPSRYLSTEARTRFRELVDGLPVDFFKPDNLDDLNEYLALSEQLRTISATINKEGRFYRDADGICHPHHLLDVQQRARMEMLDLSDRLLCNPEARKKAGVHLSPTDSGKWDEYYEWVDDEPDD